MGSRRPAADGPGMSRLHGLVLSGLLAAALTPASALAQTTDAVDPAATDDVAVVDDATTDDAVPADATADDAVAPDDELADPCPAADDGSADVDDSEAEADAVDPSVPDDEPVVDATVDDPDLAAGDDGCADAGDAVAPTVTAAPLRLHVAGPGTVRATFSTRPGGAVLGRATARASHAGTITLTAKLTAAGKAYIADKGPSVRLTVKLRGHAVGPKHAAGSRKVTLRLVASTPAG